jgi:hypothetical protein
MVEMDSRTYNLDYTDVFNEAQYALVSTGAIIKLVDFNNGYLRAETGMSITSYGETLEVTIRQVQGGTWVTIQSKPTHYFTDMGRSKRHVRTFIMAMDSRVGAFGAPGVPGNMPQAGYYAPPSPQYAMAMNEPSGALAIVLTFVNAGIALLLAFAYMSVWFYLGVFMLGIAALMIAGVGLMAAGVWRLGGALAMIGGVITIPLGILGILGGLRAWEKGKIQLQVRTGQAF